MNIVLKLCCKMLSVYGILVVSSIIWRTVSVSHSLLGTYTAVNTDEFTCVLWLDGEVVDSYSSNGTDSVPRRNWMRERGRSLWTSVKLRNMKHWNRGRIDILKNDTGLNTTGAAVLQGRFGCEIELNPDSGVRRKRTFAQYGWNGEDFLSFNLRLQWVASKGSAVPMKSKWNSDQDITMETKKYLEDICVIDLTDILSFEAKESKETPQPTTAVFAKRSLNPGKVILTCLVSGFHCRDTTVELYRDDDIITEEDGLLSSGIRPNRDGTCQLRKSLDISNSTEASYSCEFPFGSLKLVKWGKTAHCDPFPLMLTRRTRSNYLCFGNKIVTHLRECGMNCQCGCQTIILLLFAFADGKISDRAEPKQHYNTRHRYGLLMASLVFVIVLLLLGLRWWCTQRTEDSGCFNHCLTRRWNPDGMKPSSVDSSS